MSVTFNLVITMERVKIWLMNTSVTVRMDLTAKAAQIVSKDMVSFNRTQNVLLHLKNEPYNHVQKRTVPWKNWTVPSTNRSLQYRNFTFLFKKKPTPKRTMLIACNESLCKVAAKDDLKSVNGTLPKAYIFHIRLDWLLPLNDKEWRLSLNR